MLRELCWPWLKGRGEEFGSAAVSFGRATSRRGWRSGGVWQNPLLKSSGNDDSPCVPFLAACAITQCELAVPAKTSVNANDQAPL
ncbi:hypothetical protein V9T40_005533 [Parthenolecanium corni]|uniref:Uncharacterized protein n=1 Tax=Parthenolecanium corni TaxID=536013 RepID=A0AAN9TV98_9HEMI